MANPLTNKRLMIDDATRSMVISVAVASFITIFALFSGHTLTKVMAYQNRVISKQNVALNQLTADVSATQQLSTEYTKFNNASQGNLLGGPTTGSGQNAGNNAKLVLDALPSSYDFPALATSLDGLLSNRGVTVGSITGTDTGSTTGASAAVAPATGNIGSAAPIPISFSITGTYQNIQNVVGIFEKSIRPFQFLTLSLSGSQNALTLNVSAQTFYQPSASFNVTKEVVE